MACDGFSCKTGAHRKPGNRQQFFGKMIRFNIKKISSCVWSGSSTMASTTGSNPFVAIAWNRVDMTRRQGFHKISSLGFHYRSGSKGINFVEQEKTGFTRQRLIIGPEFILQGLKVFGQGLGSQPQERGEAVGHRSHIGTKKRCPSRYPHGRLPM